MTLHTVCSHSFAAQNRPVWHLEIRCDTIADRELADRFLEAMSGHDAAVRLTTMLDLLDQLEGRDGH